MKAERDELTLRVFPALRKICEERGISWGEVDLRWGIPEEKNEELLNICLKCIEECRPYFIGILGERYGSVKETIPNEVIKDYPWINDHNGKSITELEFLHGVLNNPMIAGHAHFYFRDPNYIKTLPVDQQASYLEGSTSEEITTYGADEAEHRAEKRRQQLMALKETIRKSGLPVKEGYRDPVQFGELVKEDWIQVIDSLAQPPKILTDQERTSTALDREDMAHEAFVASRFGIYIPRQEYFDRLDAHIAGDSPPLVVLGDSGSGKSALLAHWTFRYRIHHPDDLVLAHFVGASSESSDWASMLRRFMGEFKRHFSLTEEIPIQDDVLLDAFGNWLSMAAAHSRVVLVIDALNQLEDRDGALDLIWFPPKIPGNIRVIVSILDGRPLNAIHKWGWHTMNVEPLTVSERNALITCYLRKYRRELEDPVREELATAEQAKNPLFLRALLEELRVHGEFDKLPDQIREYLAAQTVDALYEMILSRYERDYERDCPDLVKDAVSLLWSARWGLSKSDLMNLLGTGGRPLPDAYWAPLFLAMEHSLVEKAGRITFFHDYLRMAVEHRYLPAEEPKRVVHLRIAEFLAVQSEGPRRIEELPWQLAKAAEWDRLVALLTDPSFFLTAWQECEYDIKRYWVLVEAGSSHRMVVDYHNVIKEPSTVPISFLLSLRTLLHQTGHLDDASSLDDYLIMSSRKLGNMDILQSSLDNKALILKDRGDLTGARELLKEEEGICQKCGDKYGLQVCFGNQAVIQKIQGDLTGARDLLKKQERICRKIGNTPNLAISFGNQANILWIQGDPTGAMILLKKEEQICRKNGDQNGLQRSLTNQAGVLFSQGDLNGAMKIIDERVRNYRELGNRDGLQTCFGNRAAIFFNKGDYDCAMFWRREEERVCREIGKINSLSISRIGQAAIFFAQGDHDSAMTLWQEEEQICRNHENIEGLIECLICQASIFIKRRDIDGAMTLHKKVEEICRKYNRFDPLQRSLGNQAQIFMNVDHGDHAMTLLNEQEQICRKIGNVNNLATCLVNQSQLFSQMKRHNDALSAAEDAYNLAFGRGYTALAKQILPILEMLRREEESFIDYQG